MNNMTLQKNVFMIRLDELSDATDVGFLLKNVFFNHSSIFQILKVLCLQNNFTHSLLFTCLSKMQDFHLTIIIIHEFTKCA